MAPINTNENVSEMEDWFVTLAIDRNVAKKYAMTLAQDDFGYTKPTHLKNVTEQILRDAGVSVARHRGDILAAVKQLSAPAKPPIDSREALQKKIRELSAPSLYSERPYMLPSYINCCRGDYSKYFHAIPTTLMNRFLAEFHHNVLASEPTREDCYHAIKLIHIASEFYKREDELTQKLNEWGTAIGIRFYPELIGDACTDGSIVYIDQRKRVLIVNRLQKSQT